MDESKVPHLIDEVQRRPAIWNKSLSEHNNKNFIGSEWNKVAANINVSKASAQNKWKALVKKFKTEHSRVLLHRSGDGLEDVYKSAWPYYVSLSFLAHYTVPNSSSGNLNCLFELKPSITDKSSNESLQSSDLNSNQDSHMMNKKEKDIAEEILRMENQKFALLEKSACHNPQANNSVEQDKLNMAFFETLLPILREVSKEDILLCRTDISRVVFNYAYKDVVWKSLSDSSKPANESSPIPPKIRKFDDDDDCQIIGSFKLPTNISVKVEKKYQPSTKERDIERQNFNNNASGGVMTGGCRPSSGLHETGTEDASGSSVSRIPSTLSVTAVDVVVACRQAGASPSHSILTLTPGRTRNIDQDMEALRLSRQDNPFLQSSDGIQLTISPEHFPLNYGTISPFYPPKSRSFNLVMQSAATGSSQGLERLRFLGGQVLASKESLIEPAEESESDDAILMSQEFGETDPLTLAQVHEHLVRSPPPASWTRTPMFHFSHQQDSPGSKSDPSAHYRTTSPKSMMHRPADDMPKTEGSMEIRDRHSHTFSLLNPTPIRSLSEVRRLHRSAEDSVQLMSSE